MKNLILATLALVIAGSVHAQAAVIAHGPQATIDAIMTAERTYSARMGEVGIAKGMREMLDQKDGLAFTGAGDPSSGPAIYAAYGGDAPSSLKLSWIPVEVFASAGGDMAASWGRFTIVTADSKVKPVTGRYVTVWRRGADGKWRAIMNIGNPDGG